MAGVLAGSATLAGCVPPPPSHRADVQAQAAVQPSTTAALPPVLGPASTGAVHAKLTQTAELIGNKNVPKSGGLVMSDDVAVDVMPAVAAAGTVLRVSVLAHATIPTVNYQPGNTYICSGNDRSKLGWGTPFGLVFGSLVDQTSARLAFYPAPARAGVLPTGRPVALVPGVWRRQGSPVKTVSDDQCSENIDRADTLEFTLPAGVLAQGRYLVVPWDPIDATGFHEVNGRPVLLPPADLGAKLTGTLPMVTVTSSTA
jgi:hypothetical protein